MLRSSLTRRPLCFFNAPTEQPGSPAPAAGAPVVAPVASAPPATIGEQIRAAVSAKVTIQRELDAARAELSSAGTTIATLTTDLATTAGERDTFKAQVGSLTTEVGTLKARVAELEAGTTTVAAGVEETVAAIGFPAGALPAEQSQPGANSADAIFDRWQSAEGTEKQTIYQANKAAIHTEARRRKIGTV